LTVERARLKRRWRNNWDRRSGQPRCGGAKNAGGILAHRNHSGKKKNFSVRLTGADKEKKKTGVTKKDDTAKRKK